MPERGFLVINPRSGEGSMPAPELAEEARKRGIAAHILNPQDDLAELARSSPADAIGVAGGDGTLGLVASAAIERGLPFVCVPRGTRNHFARDLGLDPSDPVAALAAFGGTERAVDVGRAGGRIFLNNVSIGLYAGLVRERERHHIRHGLVATGRAILRSLHHRPDVLTIGQGRIRTRLVLVSNNYYKPGLLSVGRRERLDEGRLHLYFLNGRLPIDWESYSGETFEIGAESDELRAAFDGEPVVVKPPLELRVEPRALRVRVPPHPGG
jgi:diacylglycerol kinase family enzyme